MSFNSQAVRIHASTPPSFSGEPIDIGELPMRRRMLMMLPPGVFAIDWGVYGVSETFVIDRRGRTAFKHVGAVTSEVYRTKLAPLIEELRK